LKNSAHIRDIVEYGGVDVAPAVTEWGLGSCIWDVMDVFRLTMENREGQIESGETVRVHVYILWSTRVCLLETSLDKLEWTSSDLPQFVRMDLYRASHLPPSKASFQDTR